MIFTLQKRTIRIIAGVKSSNSCRNLFMRLEILPLPCKYILTLMNLVVNNQEHFQQNTVLTLGIGTIFIDQLPTSHVFKKSTYYAGIKIFNSLPPNLRSLMNKQTQFKAALKRYLNTHPFYSVEEFLMFKNDSQYVQKFFPTVCCMDLV
jgi:hypothetical protein